MNQILDVIKHWARTQPDAVFAQDARSDRALTYGQLAQKTFVEASNTRTGVVELVEADPIVFAARFVSLIATGKIVVPLDPSAPAAENERLLGYVKDADVQQTSSIMLFSSGSTGERKLIQLNESQLLHAARTIAEHHELKPGERGYNSLPLHHVNAEVVGVLATFVSGATIVLDAGFHKTGFWKLMDELNITWINAVPAIITILAGEDTENYDRSAIRFVRSASAPLPVAVLNRFQDRLGIPIVETYGITEGASQIVANPLHGMRKPGSVGLPTGIDLRITDGHVEIRGASVITSYVNGVAADKFSADGWLDTGDQGYVDEDGYVFLIGRTDDVINRAGEKIFPREIEELLMRDENVTAALVAPKSDDVAGHVPVAFVTLKSGDDTATLAQLCADNLPKYMRPVAVIALDDLPRGATGKLSRRKAAELAEALDS